LITSEDLMGEGAGERFCISKLTCFMTEDMMDEVRLFFPFLGVDLASESGTTDSERSR
jgi:hypothetical protein